MPGSSQDGFVLLGKVAAAHGVQGWNKILSYTEPREGILNYHRLMMRKPGGEWMPVELKQGRRQGKGIVAQLACSNDRDAALALMGAELAVERNALPELPEDEYYWHQLEGLRVYSLSFVTRDEGFGKGFKKGADAGPDISSTESSTEIIEGSIEGFIESPGLLLGKVDHMMATGANDVMVVKPCDSSIDERERLIPFLLGHVVREVDLSAGAISVEWDPDF